MKHAVVQDETKRVINVVVWGGGEWTADPGCFTVGLNPGEACQIGDIYDFEADPRFIRQEIPVPTGPKFYTAYQFLLRFTPEERAAFRAAANTDSIVADFQQLAGAAQEVWTDDPMTIAGMGYLVAVGLLTESRKNEILA